MNENKCHAGTILPKTGPCPRCGSDDNGVCWVSINEDIADAKTLRGFTAVIGEADLFGQECEGMCGV